LRPLDEDAIVKSVEKTHRAVAVQEQWRWFGVASEVAAIIQDRAFDCLDAPVERVSGAEVPAPYARNLELAAFPNEQQVVEAARRVLYQGEIGDVLAEIETDKSTMELTAEDAGTLQEIIASEGDAVPVGEAIAVIVGDGEEAPPRREAKQAEDGARGDGVDEAPAATATEVEAPGEQEGKAPEDEESGPSPAEGSADGRVRASPIVRRLAGEHNIDLSGIRGTGPAGRIVERDVRTALETDGGPVEERPADSTTAGPAPTGAPGTELKPLSRMQRVVGERMQQSWRQAPHHYATVGVHVDDLLALRKQLNAGLEEDGIKLSINDFVMKSCAVALRKFPKLNSLWTAEGIEWHATVDLAMAVALEDGLVTPVIKDVANKTLSSI